MNSVRDVMLVLIVMGVFASPLLGERPLSKPHGDFYDYVTSSEFDASFTFRLINPQSFGSDSDSLTPACLIYSVFTPKHGIAAKVSMGGDYCLAKDGVCEEPIECARRQRRQDYADGHSASVEAFASISESATNKHGKDCWLTKEKDRTGVLQFVDGKDVLKEVCTVAYSCENRPEPTYAACPMTTEVVTVGGTTQTKKVCPQLNDCINNGLTVPGYTKKEFDALLPTEQERARRWYETGVEEPVSAVKKVTSTLPRQAGAAGRPVDGHSK